MFDLNKRIFFNFLTKTFQKKIISQEVFDKKYKSIYYIFIIYICLKQNYIKQYRSLQTNTLFSGYRILKLTGFAKKGAIQDF